MVGLRVFDIGALIVWLVWFFKLRDDDDDDGGGGGGRGPDRGPDGGPPLPDAGPWPRRRRDHLGDLTPGKVDQPDQVWEVSSMARLTPDPTFYASPSDAASAPAETHAYVVALNTGTNGDRAPDALTVLDLEAGSPTYGQLVGRLDMPNVGDELHHFGWNACSSALCPWAAHPHVERRYLLVPGLRSSRIHIVDVKDDPHNPTLAKVIEPDEIASQDRLLAPAHDPLRPRRDLRLRARRPRRRRARRHLPARPRELLASRAPGSRTAGRRSSPTTSGGTSTRARSSPPSGARRTWSRTACSPSCCWATSTATSSTSGTSRSARTSRRSTSAPSTRWCSSCGPRTTRARPTASSAWSRRPPT